jgi:hypothetical protein
MIGMPKGVRIFDLAKELNMSSKDLIALFGRLGIDAASQLSLVEPRIADLLRRQLDGSVTTGAVVPHVYDTAGERLTREHQARRAAGDYVEPVKPSAASGTYEPTAARIFGNSVGGSEAAGHAPIAERGWQFDEPSPGGDESLKLPRQNYNDDDG